MAAFNFDRVSSKQCVPKEPNPDYKFASPLTQLVFEVRDLMIIIGGLYNYANQKFDKLLQDRIGAEAQRAYYEEHLLKQSLNDLRVYLHYWPQAFTYDLLKELDQVLLEIESVHNNKHGSTEIDVEIARTRAKVKLVLSIFQNEWIREDYYTDPKQAGLTSADPKIVKES